MNNTNDLSNLQVMIILALIFSVMFIVYKIVMRTGNKKNKVIKYKQSHRTYKQKPKTKIKIVHDTSYFNFTNDSKADYIQSCWDELNK